MKKISQFPSVACMSGGISAKFSDCGDTHLFFGIFCKLNEVFGVDIPDKSYYAHLTDRCARTSGTVRTICWFNPDLLNVTTAKRDVFLSDGQWAKLHCDNMTAVIKGGHNKEPHNHNDIGSYMFIKGERVIADELGAAKYTKSYFEADKRYSFLNASSQGHSLPIVNGYAQRAGIEASSDRFEKTDRGVLISFKNAYDEKSGLVSLVRNLSLDENGVMISDSFAFSSDENTVCERIITKYDAKITNKNTVSISHDEDEIATVEFLHDGIIRILHEGYTIPNSSGKTDEYSEDDKMQYATIIEFEKSVFSHESDICYIIR